MSPSPRLSGGGPPRDGGRDGVRAGDVRPPAARDGDARRAGAGGAVDRHARRDVDLPDRGRQGGRRGRRRGDRRGRPHRDRLPAAQRVRAARRGRAAVPRAGVGRRHGGEPAAPAVRRDRRRAAWPTRWSGCARRARPRDAEPERAGGCAAVSRSPACCVLYALQALYSTDLEQALKNVCLFYVPFALLFRLLLDVRWTRRLLRPSLGLIVGLALVFAAIGFVEFATGRLLISNAKVHRGQRPQAVLPRQLAVLRPEHLRALPGADDDPARRRAAVDARARARPRCIGAALAVLWARPRALALAVELRGAAGRARGAGRAALEAVAGDRA